MCEEELPCLWKSEVKRWGYGLGVLIRVSFKCLTSRPEIFIDICHSIVWHPHPLVIVTSFFWLRDKLLLVSLTSFCCVDENGVPIQVEPGLDLPWLVVHPYSHTIHSLDDFLSQAVTCLVKRCCHYFDSKWGEEYQITNKSSELSLHLISVFDFTIYKSSVWTYGSSNYP